MLIIRGGRLLPIIFSMLLCACNIVTNTGEEEEALRREVLERVKAQKKLVAVLDNTTTNYYIYRGEPLGYQYEILKAFAESLGVTLEIRIVDDVAESFRMLDEGRCDLLAQSLTVTKARAKKVDFSVPLLQTRLVLVQRKDSYPGKGRRKDDAEDTYITNPLELIGKTVHIQDNLNYLSRLIDLSNEIGADINIIELPDESVEDMIRMLSRGKIDYTVCEEHIALANQKFYSNLDVSMAISFPQNISWAVKKGSVDFLEVVDTWLEEFRKSKISAVLYDKYFRHPLRQAGKSGMILSERRGLISSYDKLIQQYSKDLGWDWRLLASLIYQESGFDPYVRAWTGAFGLMQMMPATAALYGVDSLSGPEEQIRAGVEYLRMLDRELLDKVPDSTERIRFVLASYNAGIGHIYDAIALAAKHHKNPQVWKENVDVYIRAKSKPEFYHDPIVKSGFFLGEETYSFVLEVIERYEHYRNILKE
jgi:membrane-bound lytic murein transglycosylase F